MQSWWDRHVVSRMVRCGCSLKALKELRDEVIPLADGDVLELGVGAGANFALYDAAKVTSVTGIDPSAALLKVARREGARICIPCALHQTSAENLGFNDNSFDTVTTTFTLCSVTDPARVLAEARRVLKPGGKLLFLEHAQSPDEGPRHWQSRIEPIWKHLSGNCHLTRPAIASVADSGLIVREQRGFYMPNQPRWLSWLEWGVATKS